MTVQVMAGYFSKERWGYVRAWQVRSGYL